MSGCSERKPVLQQISKQRMIAEPTARPADADHECVRRDQRFQHQLAVGAAGQRGRQGGIEPFGNAGSEQEIPVGRWQPVEHLTDQVFGDGLLGATEPGDFFGGIGCGQRQRRQPQSSGPPLGAPEQLPHLIAGQIQVAAIEQFGGFCFVKGQILCPDLGQSPADPDPVQAQRWIRAADQHQPEMRRLPVDQLVQRIQAQRSRSPPESRQAPAPPVPATPPARPAPAGLA